MLIDSLKDMELKNH